MRLKDKVIIVTGSTTGIGKAIAKRCVHEGAKVVIHGLEKNLAEATLAEIGAANGVIHIEDLTSPGCPQRLVDLGTTRPSSRRATSRRPTRPSSTRCSR
ncbi:MAG: hypothetical protein RLZ70_2008 [Verrucomicrobiota bacterium]